VSRRRRRKRQCESARAKSIEPLMILAQIADKTRIDKNSLLQRVTAVIAQRGIAVARGPPPAESRF